MKIISNKGSINDILKLNSNLVEYFLNLNKKTEGNHTIIFYTLADDKLFIKFNDLRIKLKRGNWDHKSFLNECSNQQINYIYNELLHFASENKIPL